MPKRKSSAKGSTPDLKIPKLKKPKIKAITETQAEWADRFVRAHRATIGDKKKPRNKLRVRKPVAPPKPKKRTVTKTKVTRKPR